MRDIYEPAWEASTQVTRDMEEIARGQIWRIYSSPQVEADFALVVQNDALTPHLESVVVLPVVRAEEMQPSPSAVVLTPELTGFAEPMAVLCGKIGSLPKASFICREAQLSPDGASLVRRVLSMVLDCPGRLRVV